MNKRIKRMLSFCLAFSLLFSCMMINASIAFAEDTADYVFEFNANTEFQSKKGYVETYTTQTKAGSETSAKIFADAETSGSKLTSNATQRWQFNTPAKIFVPVDGVSAVKLSPYFNATSAIFTVADLNNSENITYSGTKEVEITTSKYFEGSTLSEYGYTDADLVADTTKYVCITTDTNDYIKTVFKTMTKEGTSAITATGSISGLGADESLVFTNKTTNKKTTASIEDGKYTASLYSGCSYSVQAVDDSGNVVSEGADLVLTSAENNISLSNFETVNATINLSVPNDGIEVYLNVDDTQTKIANGSSYPVKKGVDFEISVKTDRPDEYNIISGIGKHNLTADGSISVVIEKNAFHLINGSLLGAITPSASDIVTFSDISGVYTYSTYPDASGDYSLSVLGGKAYNVSISGHSSDPIDICEEYKTTAEITNDTSHNLYFEYLQTWNLKNTSDVYSAGTNMVGKYYKGLSFSGNTAKSSSGSGVDIYGYKGNSTTMNIPIPPTLSGKNVKVSVEYYENSSDTPVLSLGSKTITLSSSADGTGIIEYTTDGSETSVDFKVAPIDGDTTSANKIYLYSVTLTEAVAFKNTVTVGSDKDYQSIEDAFNAISAMDRGSETKTVTISVDPGVYRVKRLNITLPNIKIVNSASPTTTVLGNASDLKNNVIITGYYGYGTTYKTTNNSDPDLWGATVVVKSSAKNFEAEYITFENSFNLYVTDEEKEDIYGASSNSDYGAKERAENINSLTDSDVRSKTYTERATALINYADGAKFNHCSFISSQDTLMTGNSDSISGEFNNCTIQGNTDYIFGTGTYTFNNCNLLWGGYSDTSHAGYITAAGGNSAFSPVYIFNYCSIDKSNITSDNYFTDGYYGRPWNTTKSSVVFANPYFGTSSINSTGWANMSSLNASDVAGFAEYGFNIDTTNFSDLRKSKVVDSLNGLVRIKGEDGETYLSTRNENEIAVIGGLKNANSNISEVGFIYVNDYDIAESFRGVALSKIDTSDKGVAIAKTNNVYSEGVKVKYTNKENEVFYKEDGVFNNSTSYYFAEGIDISNIGNYDTVYIIPYIKQSGIYYCSVAYDFTKE